LVSDSGPEAFIVSNVNLAAAPESPQVAYFVICEYASLLISCVQLCLSVGSLVIHARFLLFSRYFMPFLMHVELLTTDLLVPCLDRKDSAICASHASTLLPFELNASPFASSFGGLLLVQGSTSLDMPSLPSQDFQFVLATKKSTAYLLWSPDVTTPMVLGHYGRLHSSLPRLTRCLHDCISRTRALIRGGLLFVIRWSCVGNVTVDRDAFEVAK
jgi:hypothetical protein